MTCSRLDQCNLIITITDTAWHGSRYYLSIKSHLLLSAGDIHTLRSTIRTVSPHPSRAAAAYILIITIVVIKYPQDTDDLFQTLKVTSVSKDTSFFSFFV